MELPAYQRMVAGRGGCWPGVVMFLCMCDNTIVRPAIQKQARPFKTGGTEMTCSLLLGLVWWVHLDCHVGVAGPCLVLGYEALGAHHWKYEQNTRQFIKYSCHFLRSSKAVKNKRKMAWYHVFSSKNFSFWQYNLNVNNVQDCQKKLRNSR